MMLEENVIFFPRWGGHPGNYLDIYIWDADKTEHVLGAGFAIYL